MAGSDDRGRLPVVSEIAKISSFLLKRAWITSAVSTNADDHNIMALRRSSRSHLYVTASTCKKGGKRTFAAPWTNGSAAQEKNPRFSCDVGQIQSNQNADEAATIDDGRSKPNFVKLNLRMRLCVFKAELRFPVGPFELFIAPFDVLIV